MQIAATFDTGLPRRPTDSGHPLAAASIVGSIDAMKEEGVVENAAAIGETLAPAGVTAGSPPGHRRCCGLGVFWRSTS